MRIRREKENELWRLIAVHAVPATLAQEEEVLRGAIRLLDPFFGWRYSGPGVREPGWSYRRGSEYERGTGILAHARFDHLIGWLISYGYVMDDQGHSGRGANNAYATYTPCAPMRVLMPHVPNVMSCKDLKVGDIVVKTGAGRVLSCEGVLNESPGPTVLPRANRVFHCVVHFESGRKVVWPTNKQLEVIEQ